jgi:hypothetical protein
MSPPDPVTITFLGTDDINSIMTVGAPVRLIAIDYHLVW